VSFPPGGTSVGSMVLKSAWKVFSAADVAKGAAARFHVMQAWVYTDSSEGLASQCAQRTLGLVGLHIAHKVQVLEPDTKKTLPRWVWSTFEQVDNAPTPADTSKHKAYTFFNPRCRGCAVNTNILPPWDPDKPGKPTQVIRQNPIDSITAAANTAWQRALA